MDAIEAKLLDMGLTLPEVTVPAASYLPFRINGNTLYLAGVISQTNGVVTHAGKVGQEKTVEEGYAAARLCALNALASVKAALVGLARVQNFLLLSGYVNAVAGFDQSPQVINGASDLFVALYGDIGRHARAAVAVAGLPRNATVEIQVTLSFK
jgi:enamine deaminase RidA (YjgF/YER057c/UK114 family)